MLLDPSVLRPIQYHKEQEQLINKTQSQMMSNVLTTGDRQIYSLIDRLMGSKRKWPLSGPNNGPLPSAVPKEELRVRNFMESCVFKAGISCVGGCVIGVGLGVFTASIDPMSTIQTSRPGEIPTLKDVWREMKARSIGYAKNFAIVGLVFSTIECNIETYRAKADIKNGTYAGFVTGGLLGFRAGLQAGVLGALFFATFSTAVEYYLMYHY
ncbi:unnamed protein product [Didymodactylos carnosus]|uniref:Mitochondrial import inner membrane translocase subunit TIM22 n=1 Tax=Didymodactylos carnosus TaxID=1234261 RepID=A0A813RXR0_9BILA|nr:unnamed protein product [Didymodactylos carnosus]CAF0787075.1 unnamed protein product [Didymodactylos carnosus]CAF3495648.1 unnamed protein product [Didymodactylos carnosus]CAF3571029.1 unnamed protein product [Didymodactylos carnosus]